MDSVDELMMAHLQQEEANVAAKGESRGEINWCQLHYLVLFVELINII
jgi:hypothetical protein